MRALIPLVLLSAAPARAAFEDHGSGARAPGMGNAFTALADDLYAIHYNPSGLAQLERPQTSAAYARLYMGLSDGSDLSLSQFAYAHPLRRGSRGTLGGAYQRFALSDLYNESSLWLSYGRTVYRRDSGGHLMAGLSAKHLTHSFRQLPEAFNACSGAACNQGPDPVLSGAASKSAIDADLGLLYRFPRKYQAGLLVEHLMRPNVGFSDSDKLPMNMRLGGAYRSIWMSLVGELRLEQAPGGASDKKLVLGAERYFASLDLGQFGLRGSMGFGSRQWRQIAMGLSYRINKIQMDYGFQLPIGTVKGTAGTHRTALTFHFGAPSTEEEIANDLLEQARRMARGGSEYGYEYADVIRPHDLSDPKLADVTALIQGGRYRKAQARLAELTAELPPDSSLVRLNNRLDLIAQFFPELSAPAAKWETAIATAAASFLNGKDRSAVLHASYARSLSPQDGRLGHFLDKLERGVGIKAVRLPDDHPRDLVQELLFRVEAANNRGEYDGALSQLEDVRVLEPDNATALERTGSVHYVLGRYREAVAAWEQALAVERDPKERDSLAYYVAEARRRFGQDGLPGAVPPAQPAAPEPQAAPLPPAQPLPTAAPVKEPQAAPLPPAGPFPTAAPVKEPQAPAPRPQARGSDPRDIPKLYQKGVEHYARGEYLQAWSAFMRILQIDPENAQAKKALERIQRNVPKGRRP